MAGEKINTTLSKRRHLTGYQQKQTERIASHGTLNNGPAPRGPDLENVSQPSLRGRLQGRVRLGESE